MSVGFEEGNRKHFKHQTKGHKIFNKITYYLLHFHQFTQQRTFPIVLFEGNFSCTNLNWKQMGKPWKRTTNNISIPQDLICVILMQLWLDICDLDICNAWYICDEHHLETILMWELNSTLNRNTMSIEQCKHCMMVV